MMLRNNLTAKNRQSLWMKANKRASSIPSNLILMHYSVATTTVARDSSGASQTYPVPFRFLVIEARWLPRVSIVASETQALNQGGRIPCANQLPPHTIIAVQRSPRFLLTRLWYFSVSGIAVYPVFLFPPIYQFSKFCPMESPTTSFKCLTPLIKCHFNAL